MHFPRITWTVLMRVLIFLSAGRVGDVESGAELAKPCMADAGQTRSCLKSSSHQPSGQLDT